MPAESTLDQKLQEAHRRRIAAQLPSLGWVMTGGAVLWLGLVRLTSPGSLGHTIPAEGTLAILAFQILAFAGATVLCRRDPSSPRVTVIAVATTIVVGLVWVWMLTATATIAATLMFATLTLFSAAPLVLAWRLGPQLVFQGSLSIVWILALPVLPRLVPLEELVFAIGLGNFLALCATQWAVNAFRTEVLARFAAVDFDRQITESRDAYRALAENAVDFIWAIDLDGRWTYVNEALARRCGMSAASMIGRPVTEILTANPANPDLQPLIARAAAGEPIDAQLLEMRTPDWTCWVEARAVRVHDADGRVIGIQGVSRDVTAQRAAEAALRASERWFRTFAESMAAGVLIAEADGIAYVNDALSVISGYSRDELLRMQVWDLVHPDERATARAKVKARLDGARLLPHAEYRLATKSGEPRWVDITVAMLEIDGVVVMLATAFDVTERKLAEQALRASEARYRGLVESQREIVLRFDASGIVTFANDAYCATYGVSRDETLGKPFWPLVHPDDVETLRTGVEATMQAPFRGHAEVRSLTTTGWRWFEWEGSAIRDSSGTVLEGQAAGRDVTERRRAQDDLRASLAELRRSEEKLRLLAQRQVAIREEERKRLSFDLHDDVCQELVGIGILIESVQGRLGASPPETPRCAHPRHAVSQRGRGAPAGPGARSPTDVAS